MAEHASDKRAEGKRRRGREMALQMLYQRDLAGSETTAIFGSFDVNSYRLETSPGATPAHEQEAFLYARRLVEGTLANLAEIDRLLASQAENWRLERMAAVDRNILRLAVYELCHEADVPKVVVVDEAIELAKKFGSEQSGAFVNGLLDGLLKKREQPGAHT